MAYTRREFGRLALATLPAAALFEKSVFGSALLQAKPNSVFNGVQIGTITYSYRSMPDQSAEATLRYIVESGISACELMGGPVNDWAQKKGNYPAELAAGRAGRGGGGRAGRPGGPGGEPGGRGEAPSFAPVAGMMTGPGNNQPAGQWNGQPCPAPRGGGAARGGAAAGRAGAGARAGGGGRGQQTPEQMAAAAAERKWRSGLSMDIFKDLRKMYNDAGVSIYAVKDIQANGTDEDLDYAFTVAKTLGASHVTLELPAGPDASKTLKRLGDTALKHQMLVAYHTHQQGSMTVFDEAFAVSKGNMANVDLGHFVAATNPGGSPLDFLNKFHGRISSFHLKDRTTMAHCALNLPWGTGETPIKAMLQLVAKNGWKFPASIELEYQIPQTSDAVQEVKKCVQYCKDALM